MTVRELISKLDQMSDQDRQIILAGDEEGNSFGTISDMSICGYTDVVILFPHIECQTAEEATEAGQEK